MGSRYTEPEEEDERFVASDVAENAGQPGEVAGPLAGDWSNIRGWAAIQGGEPVEASSMGTQ